MAAAVAQPPQLPQMRGIHAQISHDALLDTLLASCDKSSKNPPLPSFGRDLKPYFTTEAVSEVVNIKKTLTSGKKTTRNKTMPPVATAAAAAAASTKAISAPKTGSPSKKGNLSAKQSTKRGGSPLPTATATANSSKAVQAIPHGGKMAALLSWAGPGFCVAPSPDKLPAPTMLLLA